MIYQTDSIPTILSRVDTLYIDRIDPLYQETYIDLLERSNQQISLVGNPFSYFIAGLGLLFAIGAIVSGYHILTMSRNFDKEKKKLLKEMDALKIKYQVDLDGMVNANKEQLNSIQIMVKNLTNAEKIAREDLNKLRGAIHRSANAINNTIPTGKELKGGPIKHFETSYRNKIKCENCNEYYNKTFTIVGKRQKGSKDTFACECPKCGYIQNHVIKN